MENRYPMTLKTTKGGKQKKKKTMTKQSQPKVLAKSITLVIELVKPNNEPSELNFRDTTPNMGFTHFLGWSDIFRRFREEDYP
jgi:hypothetical protein